MSTRFDPKLLYRRLDRLFGGIDPDRPPQEVLSRFVDDLHRVLRHDLMLEGVVLYREGHDGFDVARVAGDELIPLGSFGRDLPLLPPLLRDRVCFYPDPGAEGTPYRAGILPERPSAAVVFGNPPTRHVLFFLFAPGWVPDEAHFVLNTVRAALSPRLNDVRLWGDLRQAAEIQRSLLVDEPPEFSGFDLACRSVPAAEVGGDFYDFIPFDSEILAVAIGDASGHGLPAALLVRDVVTGLRMGIEKDFKVGHAFRKLNRVIHRSRLTSRFVSVFYGEVEPNGNLVYVNAGHLPPLLFQGGRVLELRSGGTVIGPLPEVHFHRGLAQVEPGATLLLFTDGITERRDPAGEFYGQERLQELVSDNLKDDAPTLLERIYAAVWEFGGEAPWEDDATVVVVKRQLS